nr:ATP-binding cassette subfamily G-like 7 [Brachionus rubens]
MSFNDLKEDTVIYEISNNYIINQNDLDLKVGHSNKLRQSDENITVVNIKMDSDSENSISKKELDKTSNQSKPSSTQNGKKKFQKNQDLVLSWENVVVCTRKKKSVFSCFNKQDDEKDSLMSKILKKEKPIINSSYNSVLKMENQSIESVSTISSGNLAKRKNGKILDNVTGLARSGECIAIMGASGAGKTTLLNVLNFRNSANYVTSAKLKLNGRLLNGDELSNCSAYIQQDDLFITTLTVKEHLTFLAMLKMGPKFSKEKKMERVHEIIREFNLEKCKDTKIGGIDFKKGISGGEKRRLSFASEILTDPNILFCDEPTSGLDSNMALMIVNTLAGLAKKGKIVICTIHQPSSQVFDKFDKLCLLSEGQVAYFGDRESAFDFFKSISYECPLKYNPADYYIEILAVKRNNISNVDNLQAICDAYEKSSFHKETMESLKQIDEQYRKLDNPYMTRTSYPVKRYESTYFTQFVWLFWRQLLSTLREPLATRILIVQSIVFGLFLGFTYYQITFDQAGIQNINGLLFITLMQSCLSYLFGAANQIHNQWQVTYRDSKNRVYSVLIYFIAKIFSELPQNIIFPAITITIIYWLGGIYPDAVVFFTILALLILSTNAAVGFGTFLAVTTPNINATLGLIGPVFFPMLIFSGFLINTKSIPVYFVWVKYISWAYYTNEAIMITLWTRVKEIKCPDKLNVCVRNGYDVLKQLSMDEKNFNLDVGMLIVIMIFWPTLSAVIVYLKSKK